METTTPQPQPGHKSFEYRTSVEFCTMTTFIAFALRKRLPLISYNSAAAGPRPKINNSPGRWLNDMAKEEYLFRSRGINSPLYEHARGKTPEYGRNG
ncbi:MAG TPA: hypothetical protein VJO14_03905 [Bacteroidota bacterium]|nr:hypothetical protein [Bacteroidota bacterium]